MIASNIGNKQNNVLIILINWDNNSTILYLRIGHAKDALSRNDVFVKARKEFQAFLDFLD